ncbi:hypothetical protein SAMN05421819_3587 [Bryocella elongata]|uniref:DUF4157 domain-containing protein n=2 Tax=Bryocella elongata TaxID=863522 RepID=A0A1H6B7T3_9BACT|nr:hypothetical protein SAMN05421819_3587 [Bryocella elongata]
MVGVGCALLAGMMATGALGQSSGTPSQPQDPQPPVHATDPGVTPPQVTAGQQMVTIQTVLSKKQQDDILADADNLFKFASKVTGLPIQHKVKKVFISRDEVNAELRKKFDEDKGNKRMERSELVLKKFGFLDPDFQLRPFLLSLLTEQIAGFYDAKTKTMNLLNWVPIEEQKPVMAHELTHALQDQKVNLDKWEDPQPEGVAKNMQEDNLHIQTDEAGTAREAAVEGQAMVSFADYLINQQQPGKTLRDAPQVGEQISNGAGDVSDSPVLARAPLVLQQAMLFPYTQGLAFEQAVLLRKGVDEAFSGVLANPPNSSYEVMNPASWMQHNPVPVMAMPNIHPLLDAAGYEPYDIGVMGELDVRMTTELFGGRPLAEALAPQWDGGIYYAAQRRNATPAEKQTTRSIALLYSSKWKDENAARSFMKVFEQQLGRQYDGLERRQKDETGDDERVYSTREGDVVLSVEGERVWVSEGFEMPLARNLREMVEGAQGTGPIRSASNDRSQGSGPRVQSAQTLVPRGELLTGFGAELARFGMIRAVLQ